MPSLITLAWDIINSPYAQPCGAVREVGNKKQNANKLRDYDAWVSMLRCIRKRRRKEEEGRGGPQHRRAAPRVHKGLVMSPFLVQNAGQGIPYHRVFVITSL
jgi:hypothetical protein